MPVQIAHHYVVLLIDASAAQPRTLVFTLVESLVGVGATPHEQSSSATVRDTLRPIVEQTAFVDELGNCWTARLVVLNACDQCESVFCGAWVAVHVSAFVRWWYLRLLGAEFDSNALARSVGGDLGFRTFPLVSNTGPQAARQCEVLKKWVRGCIRRLR